MTGSLGLLVTGAALALLVARQVLGAAWAGRDDAPTRARLRTLDLALIPLLVAFVAVIVIRFDRLSV